jgi:two-component system response regulator HydG
VKGRILIVDDDSDTASMLAELLRRRGYAAEAATSGRRCLEQVSQCLVDVVVTDVLMPEMSGLDLCQALRTSHPEVLTIMLTGRGGRDVAVSAIRAGAYDYLTKPVGVAALEVSIMRALAHVELRRELMRLREVVDDRASNEIAGKSSAIRKTLELVARVAGSDATVLICGESGTGKELIARAVHRLSTRRAAPFVAINCAAMPAPLLESELFGHVRGAFTDASESRHGLFVQAGDGTIFLDEIGEMPVEMQVKLLRVLQARLVRRVGADHEVPFAARVIASTNRDLEAAIATHRFRVDLCYRINVVTFDVPPLRERISDVLILAHHFVRKIAARISKPVVGLTPAAAQALVDYAWPGNVRELESCIERAVAICRFDQITVDDLPEKLFHRARTTRTTKLLTLAEMHRRHICEILKRTAGNKAKAARLLGIDRRSLYRKLGAFRAP